MLVAVTRFDLRIPGCGSLKEKRHVVKTLTAGLRQKFNDKPDQYPPPEDLPEKVNKSLIEAGLLITTDEERLTLLKISERMLVLSHVLRAGSKTAEADELSNYHNILHELARGMK